MTDAMLTLIAGHAVATADGFTAKRLSRAQVISQNADTMAELARYAAQNKPSDLLENTHHLCAYTARWAFARDGELKDRYCKLVLSFVSIVRWLSMAKRKRAA